MKNINIDFAGCNYIGELHQKIKEALDLPDFYGANLDALWDSLTGMIETPVHVNITGFLSLPSDIQKEALKILKIFYDAEETYHEIQVTSE